MSEFDIGAMMQQAQQLRDQMEQMQKALDEQVVEGSAGAGMVKVQATGGQRIRSIQIEAAALTEDTDMLQDLIVAATNNALDKARDLARDKMGSMVPPGLLGPGGIPGL